MDRLAIAVLLCCVAVTGCIGSPGPGAGTPTPDPGTSETPTEPTTGVTPTTGESVSVEYVVRAGSIAETVAHVHVDFAVYVAERPGDVYACTDDAPLYDNQYDPTPTPLPTPAGQCERFDVPEVDLASLDGERSLGEFDVDATYSGHTLVVHDVTVVLENGTTASSVYDTDFRAVTEEEPPSGTYGVEIGVTDYSESDEDRSWRFGVLVDQFDPDAD